jgi:hypothetical protein
MRTLLWDVAAQAPLADADVEDAYCRVDHALLPVRRRTTWTHGGAGTVTIELDHHVLL